MNKEYFTDNISTETLAKLIDETLTLEKTGKNGNINKSLLKIIPAAAAILLVIGLFNILPLIDNGIDNIGENITELNAGVEIVVPNGNVSVTNDIKAEVPISEPPNPPEPPKNVGGYFNNHGDHLYTYDELIKEIYDEAVLVEKTYTDISSIKLDIIQDNVVVSRGGDAVKVKYYEWTKDEYKLSDNNGKLTLKYMADVKYYTDGKGNSFGGRGWANLIANQAGRQIDPEYPNADMRTIYITVPENVTLESLDIDGVSGSINISDCSVKKINADTVGGNISVSNCTNGQNYKGDTTSGNISFSNCNDVTTITGDTTSGAVIISSCNNIQTVKADTTSGDITFKNSVIKSASADVTSGKITVQDCDIATLKVNGKTYNDVKNDTFNAPDWSDWNYDYGQQLQEQFDAEQEKLQEQIEKLQEQLEAEQEKILEQREELQEQLEAEQEKLQEQLEKLQEQFEAEQEKLQEQYDFDWDSIDWGSSNGVYSNSVWKSHNEGNNVIYELKDGTKITMSNSGGISCNTIDKFGYIKFFKKVTIEYPNGVTVNAPTNTIVEFDNGSYIIVTGGQSTITKPDGTSSTVPKNTILDNQGNIVEDTSLLNIISKNFEYGKVKSVNVDALKGTYTIEKSDTNKTTVEVSGYEKFIDLLKFDYSAETGVLKVSYDKSKANNGEWNRIIWEDSKIKITIKVAYDGDMPEELKISGNGTGTIKPLIPFKKLNISNLNGAAIVNAKNISFDNVNITVNSAAEVSFKDAKNCTFTVNSTGSIKFNNADYCKATINSAGDVTGKKVNSLTASVNSTGNINIDEVDEFTGSTNSVGNITVGKVNKSVSATISGWGDININSGNVETFYANISNGILDAKNVTAANADITVKNWGTVEIGKVTGELTKDVGKNANITVHQK